MTRDELPPFLTTRQVAEFLNCSLEFLKTARKRGTGPQFTKISPDAVRYARKSLLAWIDANTMRAA